MTTGEMLQLASVSLALISVLIMPFIFRGLTRQDEDRQAMKQEMHARLDHLDHCIDETKLIVLGKMVTRDEMNAYKLEVQSIVSRIREAASVEYKTMNDRMMRVENKVFGGGSND